MNTNDREAAEVLADLKSRLPWMIADSALTVANLKALDRAIALLSQPEAVRQGEAWKRARASEIEDAIATGKMNAQQVFTQMRQLLATPSPASPDRAATLDAGVKSGRECSHDWATNGGGDYCRRCGKREDAYTPPAEVGGLVDAEGVRERDMLSLELNNFAAMSGKAPDCYGGTWLPQVEPDDFDAIALGAAAALAPSRQAGGEADPGCGDPYGKERDCPAELRAPEMTPEEKQAAYTRLRDQIIAAEAQATHPAPSAESAGMVLVPREPTEAMVRAANEGEAGCPLAYVRPIYRAMIAAAQGDHPHAD